MKRLRPEIATLVLFAGWLLLPACESVVGDTFSFGGGGASTSSKGGGGESTSSKGGGGQGGSTDTGGAGGLCGNGKLDPGEDCDGTPGSATCADLGHDKGTPKCSATCHFDTSGCCDDECSGPSGSQECASGNAVHVCGQYDGDECLEWSGDQQCAMACVDGQCACSKDADCNMQQDQCHVSQGACENGKCSYGPKADGVSCDDGSECTLSDTCQSGTCVGGNPVICAPLDQCHVAGICDAATGECSNPNAPSGMPCNDSNACTQTDTCQGGTCTGANPIVCQPLDQCHSAGACDTISGQCSNPVAPNGKLCDDGNGCTQTDACQSGACVGANPVVCQAQDQCHIAGTCDPASGQCSNPFAANGLSCNDGNGCTQTDTCQQGVCTGATPVVCQAQDQCHSAGTCNPATGQCSNPISVNGTSCNDGNGCTTNDTCQNGACSGGNPVVCNSPPNAQCYNQAGSCSGGACSYTPKGAGTGCTDGDACTTSDVCNGAGTCGGAAIQCNSPPNQCYNTAGTCSGGTCNYSFKGPGSSCNDGDACTTNDVCNGAGICGGAAIQCNSPPNQCYNTAGTCSGGTCNYSFKGAGSGCNDGNSCTTSDVCNGAGICGGMAIQCSAPPGECWNPAGTCSGGSCQYSQKANGTACSTGVCQTGSCVACLNGQVQNQSCNLAGYCPPGTQTRTCSNGQWGAYSQCAASSSSRYCGDGATHCGAVLCIKVQPTCSSTTATAVISKADGTKFTNNADLTIYSPTTGQSLQYGCLSTANQYSTTVSFSPSALGLNALGGMLTVNAQIFSPCVGGALYISGNGYVSQCAN